MPTTTPTWLKRLMLACMVMLGVQLCYPPTLQASWISTQQVDMISLGVKDPAGKPGVHVDFDLPAVIFLVVQVPDRSTQTLLERACEDEVFVPALLPVSGFHPAAP